MKTKIQASIIAALAMAAFAGFCVLLAHYGKYIAYATAAAIALWLSYAVYKTVYKMAKRVLDNAKKEMEDAQ